MRKVWRCCSTWFTTTSARREITCPAYGPYLTNRYNTAWGSAVNFDGRGSDEVRRLVCDNALSWMRDYHIDGLRLDAIHAIMDSSPFPILEQLATETADLARRTGRRLVLIAENDLNDPRIVTSRAWRLWY